MIARLTGNPELCSDLKEGSSLKTSVFQFPLYSFLFITSYDPSSERDEGDNAGEMSPGSSTESYPAFAHIGLRENPGRNLNQEKYQYYCYYEEQYQNYCYNQEHYQYYCYYEEQYQYYCYYEEQYQYYCYYEEQYQYYCYYEEQYQYYCYYEEQYHYYYCYNKEQYQYNCSFE
ncbi:hypothetical protein ANN_23055 [Periplaneta americana]|uniref:Uncharacterized protein n=1 Tax=Periplaneta americana TaxID=6978 RepID=A0ABQ8SKE4_PERAM|nr:hypothetical protein ANN_23055 [Periplaneta americana]